MSRGLKVDVNKRLHELAEKARARQREVLLSGIDALTKPDYHRLNLHAGPNDRLLHAVLCAYAKHSLNSPDIGWDELGDILMHAITNEIGDEHYIRWAEQIRGQ